jgi:formate hydrogenlyase subunit 6/NADH:ubiquinone oxidoreductase subunit I
MRMRYPKLRELKEAVKALVRGPYTAKFPAQPHQPFEKFRGRPYYHDEECIGCAACVQVCPTGALSFEDIAVEGSGAKRVLKIMLDLCIFCGNCQANCPTEKGIVLSREFDLATTEDRQGLKQEIEKPFVLCECCNQPIVPADQFRWVANKLGALVFTNTSLLLFYLRLQGLASLQAHSEAANTTPLRSDRFKILCPSCRRQAVTTS